MTQCPHERTILIKDYGLSRGGAWRYKLVFCRDCRKEVQTREPSKEKKD